MKTIKITITKDMIKNSEYGDCRGCALWKALTNLGYEDVSVGGATADFFVNGTRFKCEILFGTGGNLCGAFTNKKWNLPYEDVEIVMEVPYLIKSEQPKVIYKTVVIDSAVQKLQTSLTEN